MAFRKVKLGTVSKLGFVLHRFLQELNGALYPLKGEGNSGLEIVFVGSARW